MPYAPVRHQAFGDDEINAVVDALREGWLGIGPLVARFESEIAALFGKRHGVMVNSGSSANLLSTHELPGGRIATPALTFATTIAYLVDRDVEIVDVEEGTYQIDFEKLEAEPDVLFVPNLLGNIPDWNSAPRVFTVEDSCDTITDAGADISAITTSSFYASHIITACGGGGILLTNDSDIAARTASRRAWGRPVVEESDLDRRFGEIDGLPYDKRFIYEYVGYNFQPLEVEAAFGLAQLRRFEDFKRIRDRNFERLMNFFKDYEDRFILPVTRPGANWLAFPLTARPGLDRNALARHLEENDIQTRPIFSGNITRQPAYKELFGTRSFPIADRVMEGGLLIGAHHGLTDEHLDYLEDVFRRYLLAN
ncbi:MAG TPA: DegT/DnrJ/EryC1/StrS family aminotransferase [Actinomycetota bacterium]|nr:DegT/DnrJ/EryC1/StrS family aminotransferase [Actinomycetota bacterium]